MVVSRLVLRINEHGQTHKTTCSWNLFGLDMYMHMTVFNFVAQNETYNAL